MKKTIVAISLAALSVPVMAQSAKAKAEPEVTISGNFALVSDYRFRGISQTDRNPALQGGFDLSHKSGLYLGTWASNVSQWANTGGSMELDLYAGYSGELTKDVTFDVGYIAYRYPGNKAAVKNHTGEIYAGVSYGPVSYKLSKTTTNWFGVAKSKGSYYHDLSFEYSPADKLTLTAHIGRQIIPGSSKREGLPGNDAFDEGNLNFTDYSIGGSYDLGDGYAIGLTATRVKFNKSGAKEQWFDTRDSVLNTYTGGDKLYTNSLVLSLSKEF